MKTVISTRFRSVFVASMMSMVSSYILILTDNVVAGQVVGDNAVVAMTLIFPIYTLLLFISYVIADGLAMLASYAQGREDRDEVNRIFSLGTILSVVSGILFFAILFMFKEEILSLWEVSEHLMNYASDYYSGLILVTPIIFLNLFQYTFFFLEGKENACLIAVVVSFVVNIALDIILCKTIGVKGIGLATTLGTLISALVQLYYLTGDRSQLKFIPYFNLKKTLQGIFYSFYHSVDTLCLSILPMILSAATIKCFGEEKLIIVTVAVNLLTLIIAIYTGMVDCLQPMICQYHAENNLHSVKKTILLGLKVTVALSLLMTLAGIIFADFLPAMFGVKDEILAQEAAEAMRFFLPFTTFLGLTLMLANYYIYIEDMNFGALIKIILLLILPYIAMNIGGQFSLNIFWLSVGGSFAVSFLLNLILTKFYGRRNNILLIDERKLNCQLSYDVNTTFDEVMNLTHRADEDLKNFDVTKSLRNKIVLFIEEIGLHAVERVIEEPFQLEFSILFEEDNFEHATMIVRDNGKPYDIVKTANNEKFSFREFFIESITAIVANRNFIASGDENRMTLRI